MLRNFFTGFFHKRCPFCRQEVHEEAGTAVHRFGVWYCSEMHADLYALGLYEALQTVYCRHAGCHGEHIPLPEAVGTHVSPRLALELSRLKRE
jgi:hypothetical protein